MIKEMGICEVIDIVNPNWEPMSWEDECKIVLGFCEKNNYMLYERVREEFFKFEGYDLAIKGGYSGVVYSDLS